MPRLNVGYIGWFSDDDTEYSRSVAICDLKEDKVARWRANHPDVRGTTDWRDLVAMDDLDAVVIATPNHLHCEMALPFLEAGKHVFLEKPMGINREEMDRLLAADQASAGHLCIDFECRASSGYERVKEILDSGEIGDLRGAQFIHYQGQWLRENGLDWRLDPDRSGGMYFECICHYVDLLRWWFGEVTEAQSFRMPNVLPQYSERMPDNITSHLFFATGATALLNTVHTFSVTPVKLQHYNDFGHELLYLLAGTKGALRLDVINHRLLVMHYTAPASAPDDRCATLARVEHSLGANPFHDVCTNRRRFLQSCARGEPPAQPAADAYETFRVCLAAEQSLAEDNRRVPVR